MLAADVPATLSSMTSQPLRTNAVATIRVRATAPNTQELEPKYLQHARKIFARTFSESILGDSTRDYPRFELNELSIGMTLGKGGFGSVSEIRAIGVDEQKVVSATPEQAQQRPSFVKAYSSRSAYQDVSDTEVDTGEVESRKFIAKHSLRNGGDARYAVKILSPETTKEQGKHCQGLVDMAIEARLLCAIEHPNIIKLRALAKKDLLEPGFFIVMDRLYDTLEKRLQKWQTRLQRTSGLAGRLTDRKGIKSAMLYEERIVAAFDLSAALVYLHERNIIYRDLKPENIGFDIRGDIKIFDFGLSKELCEKDRNADGTYRLTAETGSMRYMAGEIANGQPYNASCDVYSFAILLWEILALKTPYELYTPNSIRERVYNSPFKRPLIDAAWRNNIQILLKRSWEPNLHDRVSMGDVYKMLRKEAAFARDGDDSALEHVRRRSTFVFRPTVKEEMLPC